MDGLHHVARVQGLSTAPWQSQVRDRLVSMKKCLSTKMMLLAVPVLLAMGCGEPGIGEVRLDSGPIRGLSEQIDGREILSFKGIPYAAPPVAELRWRAPQPVGSWEAPLDCTEFGPSCPQPSSPLGMLSFSAGPTDEDCLYLNVWSPAQSAGERLPVMVWLHGGSFETGSGSMEIYSGGDLAAEGVVVVTVNYRLGPLGFLSHPALSEEAPSGVSGNYGLLDQIAALEWVQRNIAGFGGDPGNVTVFGESAGGISVLDLIVSPPAQGLFRRAIVESGVLMDQGFGTKVVADKQEAESTGEEFAARVGVDPGGDVAAQLRATTVDELLSAGDELMDETEDVEQILFWKPVVDGYVLPDMPTALWLEGGYQHVSLLIGSNADEANLFLPSLMVTEERYRELVGYIFGAYSDEALSLYPADGLGRPTDSLGRMLTEVGFAASARFAARQMSTSGADVYLYEFARAPLPLMGAFHAVELPYVFGTIDRFSWVPVIRSADTDLSTTMMGYWARFAATGDPNGDGAPIWPSYQRSSDLHLRLDTLVGTGEGLYQDACDLADGVRGAL